MAGTPRSPGRCGCGLRPACGPCRPAKGRPVAIIEHPPGAETQGDWLELPDPPGRWGGYNRKAFLLVGALAHSSKWREMLCERADTPHLVDAAPGRRRAGWADPEPAVRPDGQRRASGVRAGESDVRGGRQALRGQRRALPTAAREPQGRGGKALHSAGQRWWRTLPEDVSVAEAQARLQVFCATKTDSRCRVIDVEGSRATVSDLAAAEGLRPLPPTAFPASSACHARCGRRRWSPSAGTATRCHRSWPARR
jgi:hypothetical protein